MAKLAKMPVRGGILTVTEREVILGDGWLGAGNVRCFPLHTLLALHLLPSAETGKLGRDRLLRFAWADGSITEVERVGPAAAQRLVAIVQRLCPQAACSAELPLPAPSQAGP